VAEPHARFRRRAATKRMSADEGTAIKDALRRRGGDQEEVLIERL
jgi:hypothetical protein